MPIDKRIVLDSNIFVKLIIDELDSLKAKEYIKSLIENDVIILAPAILPYEVFYVAQKNGIALQSIKSFLLSQTTIKYIDLTNQVTSKVIEIIELSSKPKSGYPSFYDASYHAIAMLNDCDFITADKKHYEKTKHLGHIKLLSDLS
jgi:predicted nucleic acid-binding protein